MMSAVVDTSVVVKWFSQEKDGEAALRLRNDLVSDRLHLLAPDLLLYELANALRFHPRLQTGDVTAAVASVVDTGVCLRPASPALITEAVRTAFHSEITVFDAVFTALASAEDAVLITADEKLAGKIRAGHRVILLRQYENPESLT